MKTAVVFYSRDGSTKTAAGVFAKKLSADIFELEEKNDRLKKSFIAAGFCAAIGKKSRLKHDFCEQMDRYETICIGTPVWASRAVPAVNAFVNALNADGKDVIIFTVQADTNPTPKSAQKLIETLERKGAKINRVICLYGARVGKTAEIADMEKQIGSLL